MFFTTIFLKIEKLISCHMLFNDVGHINSATAIDFDIFDAEQNVEAV